MSTRRDKRDGFSFFTMVAGVMTLLKLKEKWDDYRALPGDEEGRVALAPTPYRDDENAEGETASVVPDTTLSTRRTRKKRGCCVCCGIDCTLFWKAFGIVLGLTLLYNAYRLLRWSLTPSPTGLEDMPIFSTSLGCLSTPLIYNDSKVEFSIAMGMQDNAHGFDVYGGAVGTIVVTDAPQDAQEVEYEVTIRSDDASLLKDIVFTLPEAGEATSKVKLNTPRVPLGSSSCLRYDIIMRIPPRLKELHLLTHTLSHVQFSPVEPLNLDVLYTTLYSNHDNNMILTNKEVQAKELKLEVFEGWIVGDLSITQETSVMTQRGNGVANVHVYPVAPSDTENIEPAVLRTTTGTGRTDVFFIADKAPKRPIDAHHISSGNGDIYLTYKQSKFNGNIAMVSRSYSVRGATPNPKSTAADDDEPHWTHFVGSPDGDDEIHISSNGWTGLYF